ncbi:Gfo/Idh/MocA family protein [Halogeometricum sp. CBA1124]|jgi:predicted dehydrogenase|uniref:Gfo/Idh/MocA family protein n=1 Tax=Halogeometricum sp. CBA1124 TaxID=2668071 RepID=UPI00142A63C3|nr:Gfo/Idh/MocA family oxidoreductase [Halogeometricum sp. CBA1124]MUV56968.1 gfo/Idh/MocA family oxidoreductase [Halogeometricum sp. CBA1124]
MTVRVGICSTAHVNAEVYAALLAKLPDVDLVGVSEQTRERAHKLAGTVGTAAMTHRELVRAADGVVVCSPTAVHEELVDLALRHDVAVLCEKPLATSLSTAKAIRDRCAKRDLPTGMAMPIRHSRPMARLKERYEAGSIGELVSVSGTNRGRMPGGWFVDPELAGGGAVADHTDHIVDVVRWITSEEVEEVYAETGTRFYELPVEDVNLLSMTLSNGASFFLDGSWSTPQKNPFWGDASVELVGTETTLSGDCFGRRYTHVSDTSKDRSNESIFWGADPNNALLREFVAAIRGEATPATSMDDAVRTAAVIAAAYESAERGEPVEVTY